MRVPFTTLLFLLLVFVMLSPASNATFQQVSIQPIANWTLSTFYQAPPVGEQTFGGVPFNILETGANVFFTQDAGMGIGNPVQGVLAVNVEHVAKAHILVAGTDVREIFRGQQMGSITFTYSDSSSLVYPLVVGDTIRDWATYPARVVSTESPDVTTVWHGVTQGTWGYSQAVIDKLSIDLCSSATLTGISINDDSASLLGDAGPGLYIHGVTLEVVPEPSSVLVLGSGILALAGMIRKRR